MTLHFIVYYKNALNFASFFFVTQRKKCGDKIYGHCVNHLTICHAFFFVICRALNKQLLELILHENAFRILHRTRKMANVSKKD